jgi:hypothetical protein
MEVGNMSPKELLYIEDALSHEKQMGAVCNEAVTSLTDEELKSFVARISQRHTQCFNSIFSVLK